MGNQLLHQYIYTLLNTRELHPDYAILHRDTHYDLPLAWDLTAEFRAPIVDDLVLNFVRNLSTSNGNGKHQPRSLLQSFLQQWEAKLRTFVLHPYPGEVSYRQCLDLQVRDNCFYIIIMVVNSLPLTENKEGGRRKAEVGKNFPSALSLFLLPKVEAPQFIDGKVRFCSCHFKSPQFIDGDTTSVFPLPSYER
ncbi:CRISPR-associated endonuclease Cas1 [Scytonema hofmannii]|uniref:CRISPR-associated endonuclease Cas1 n=1 Tax=Scytonema hofmannii TaxID=34078 RepID=UPI00234EEFB0|nr:CRISPR-associated endonuclease Cas1 [Scytonema hofmannii]